MPTITITLTDTQYKGLEYAALDAQSVIDGAYEDFLTEHTAQVDRYTVYKTGAVVSSVTGNKLSEHDKGGYPAVSMRDGGKYRTKRVHRVLAECFIPNPRGVDVVNHKDGDKYNYSLDNLEWVTQSENMKHAWDTGLKTTTDAVIANCKAISKIRGKQCRKMTYEDAQDVRKKYATGNYRYKDLAEEYDTSISSIRKIVKLVHYKEA